MWASGSVVGSELTDLLLPIDSDAQGSGLLTDAVFGAAGSETMPVPAHLVLRATSSPALTLRARIGRCGPSLAALIVLERSPGRAFPAREHGAHGAARRARWRAARRCSGEGGIRTPERGQPPLRDFQSRPFNRSGTSPGAALA